MSTPFSLTPEESLLWESIRRPLLTSTGEQNVAMTDAFAKAAKANLPSLNFKNDFHGQLPLLLVFLKSYPTYMDGLLPALYKIGSREDKVRVFLDDVSVAAPEKLNALLPTLFKSEKALTAQMSLLMDMGRYLDKTVFETLDFKLLLKASPEKLLKACTPTPATWDAFMELSKGLVKNDATKVLAEQIACSVALQVATAKPKPAKSAGIDQYDWLDVAVFWKKHEWDWNVGEVISTAKTRAKGTSLVADMMYAVVNPNNPSPEKAMEALNWLHAQPLPTGPHDGVDLDKALTYMYTNTKDAAVKDACLAWVNARAERSATLQYAWRVMPPEDLVTATKKLISDVLLPMGATKASLLSHTQRDSQLPGQLAYCSTRLYTILNHTDLPLGDMDAAMNKILHYWCTHFPEHDAQPGSHDYRSHAMNTMLDTIAHDLQEPARLALQESNAFKQLLLYSAYLKETNPEWARNSFLFMPDLAEKPLSMLSSVYPEHQDTWAKLQAKVLDGSFKHTDSMQLIAKVLFNQDLTMKDILSTCAALDCKPEMFFCSLQSPSAQAFIPESFDFTEVSPS